MNQNSEHPIYRIIFSHLEETQEIYAQYISEETLVGFIEADTLLEFNQSKMVINPKEVKRCYIPLHNIIRIDEVFWQNNVDIKDNIRHLPHAFKKTRK